MKPALLSTRFPISADPLLGGCYPVFVVGSARSGTSTVAHLLHEHFGYAGDAEGHVFDLMFRAMSAVGQHFNDLHSPGGAVLGAGVEWRGANAACRLGEWRLKSAVGRAVAGQVASLYGQRWFDKTPGLESVHAVPYLAALFPNARFIFMIREPVGNVVSRLRKFPDVPFRDHCVEWAEVAVAWLRARHELDEGAYAEVFSHELDADPAGVCARIARLLSDHPHPEAVRSKPFPATLPMIQRTSLRNPADAVSLDRTGWSEADKACFRSICGAPMSLFGFDESAGDGARDDADLELPAPYGQRGVTVEHGRNGGIWPELRDDRLWIYMHPSDEGRPTRLTYDDVPLCGAVRLRTGVAVAVPHAPGVRLTVTVSAFAGDSRSASIDCEPGAERELTLDLRDFPADESSTITVTIASLENHVNCAWSFVRPLRLERSADTLVSGEEAGKLQCHS